MALATYTYTDKAGDAVSATDIDTGVATAPTQRPFTFTGATVTHSPSVDYGVGSTRATRISAKDELESRTISIDPGLIVSGQMLRNRYRLRPVEIDAICWTGDNLGQIVDFTNGSRDVVPDVSSRSLIVNTISGRVRCSMGDWLVRAIGSNHYSTVSSTVFAEAYEHVTESPVMSEALYGD